MGYYTDRYELEPAPFWTVINTIEDVLTDALPGYDIVADDRDDPVLTSDQDTGYEIHAVESETYAFPERFLRWPHEIRFELPREKDVSSFTVTHGMQGSAFYQSLVTDLRERSTAVVEELYGRLEQEPRNT